MVAITILLAWLTQIVTICYISNPFFNGVGSQSYFQYWLEWADGKSEQKMGERQGPQPF